MLVRLPSRPLRQRPALLVVPARLPQASRWFQPRRVIDSRRSAANRTAQEQTEDMPATPCLCVVFGITMCNVGGISKLRFYATGSA